LVFLKRETALRETSVTTASNYLVAALPLNERRQILRLSESVELAFGTVLCEARAALEYGYFPLTCMISVSTISGDHQPLGMSLIGNRGLLGTSLALGSKTTGLRGLVYSSGLAMRLTVKQLLRMVSNNPGFARAVRQESLQLKRQIAQTALCNSFHEVEMRLARWLLMTDDCSNPGTTVLGESNPVSFHLTHQFLADLLGVQRSAVTIAAGRLQDRNLIRYARGQIKILSRTGLEAASCECYAAAKYT
jgi:hypothetical protein